MIVVTRQGLRALANYLRDYFAGLQVALFVNAVDPSPTDDFTLYQEPTFTGYTRQDLPTWTPGYVNPDGNGETDSALISYLWGGGTADVIVGYCVLDLFDNLIWAEAREDGPIRLGPDNDQFDLVIPFQLRNIPPYSAMVVYDWFGALRFDITAEVT